MMTCEHTRARFLGILGDIIQATCLACGHRWTVCDRWFSHGNSTALERHEHACASRVVAP